MPKLVCRCTIVTEMIGPAMDTARHRSKDTTLLSTGCDGLFNNCSRDRDVVSDNVNLALSQQCAQTLLRIQMTILAP